MNAARALPALSLALVAALTAACSASVSPDASEGSVSRASSPVIKGKPSDKSQDAVVLIINYDGHSQGIGECTGTLLAPRLVLTARHCVADTDEYAACQADGTPIEGGAVHGNHKADSLYIFTGPQRPDFSGGSKLNEAGRGMKILDDGGTSLCNHDIALIVLKEPITDMPIAPIRLDGEPEKGETFTAVGWGVTDKTPQPETRQQRTNVKITNVGPDESAGGVPPNEFEVGEAICSGDSGGPALASTGAIIGIVSRGGGGGGGGGTNAGDPNDPSAQCIGGSNLYTKVSPFKDLIMKGYNLAGAEPWLEGQPDPRLSKAGEACTANADCRSNLCAGDGADAKCAQPCTDASECADGEQCVEVDGTNICQAPAKDDSYAARKAKSGCSTTTGPSQSGLGFAAILAAFSLVSLRRRRR